MLLDGAFFLLKVVSIDNVEQIGSVWTLGFFGPDAPISGAVGADARCLPIFDGANNGRPVANSVETLSLFSVKAGSPLPLLYPGLLVLSGAPRALGIKETRDKISSAVRPLMSLSFVIRVRAGISWGKFDNQSLTK